MTGLSGKEVHFDDHYLHVELSDGRRISTPMSWYPELEQASVKVLRHYLFICDATGIEWPDIDYHLSIAAMLETHSQKVA
ncbi:MULTISPECIES: DUF2442 domain-containing protein [Halomonadaceae]|jgi:hypothetical protein|uniref:Uncharacterized protein n=1 Tax=Vreelandella titanicae TaxID=664683 RepID=A0A653P9N6_9GAMM|nr:MULTISPECIES: DUF2442 domain-containing protein [Halomonas]NAO97570.1 DUF2442 domain-containing protein [Halomonas sp. MG34]QGQ70042.1 DUF2442 domain-containing protein [Halomonas sp. PA16-9]UEQ05739.1 DUF2442 domain-containing protein [Halomonas profundus]MCD1589128.1 DUF2442 domain-containing protein [Halomonas sp. IOP_14]MCE7520548.1 DUF2442 domain-containing protein [Halomonas titanicae]|tara:strand:- start:63 stop:302 length:240 start_codon:yes stop_codon:yes gene_type:complete